MLDPDTCRGRGSFFSGARHADCPAAIVTPRDDGKGPRMFMLSSAALRFDTVRQEQEPVRSHLNFCTCLVPNGGLKLGDVLDRIDRDADPSQAGARAALSETRKRSDVNVKRTSLAARAPTRFAWRCAGRSPSPITRPLLCSRLAAALPRDEGGGVAERPHDCRLKSRTGVRVGRR